MALITQESITNALDWAYEKSVNGVAGLDSAIELADSYVDGNSDSPYERANSLIRWQNTKAATSGFVTGLGGLITLPVAVPANIASVMTHDSRVRHHGPARHSIGSTGRGTSGDASYSVALVRRVFVDRSALTQPTASELTEA